jgi:hypothetical protein
VTQVPSAFVSDLEVAAERRQRDRVGEVGELVREGAAASSRRSGAASSGGRPRHQSKVMSSKRRMMSLGCTVRVTSSRGTHSGMQGPWPAWPMRQISSCALLVEADDLAGVAQQLVELGVPGAALLEGGRPARLGPAVVGDHLARVSLVMPLSDRTS